MTLWDDINKAEKIIPFKFWIMAARLKTLPATLAPIILGLSFAYFEKGEINIFLSIVTLLSTLLMQIGTNFVNDYFDGVRGIDGPYRLGPKRVTSSGMIPPHVLRQAFTLVFLLAFLLGLILIYRGGIKIAYIGFFSLFAAYAYTAPPFSLSYLALGELLAFIFFGPVAVWGTYYIQVLDQGIASKSVLLSGMAPGLISACLLAINNLRDRETDQLTKKKTVAIILGENLARAFCLFLAFFPVAIPWMIPSLCPFPVSPLIFLTALVPFIFSKTWKNIAFNKIDQNFNQNLFECSQYLFIFTLVFSLGIILGR